MINIFVLEDNIIQQNSIEAVIIEVLKNNNNNIVATLEKYSCSYTDKL